jgi:hypothetical protein
MESRNRSEATRPPALNRIARREPMAFIRTRAQARSSDRLRSGDCHYGFASWT